jgi:uncharacterized protein (DUF2461 family)
MVETGVFSGFPGEGLRFLEELAGNHSREWFQMAPLYQRRVEVGQRFGV